MIFRAFLLTACLPLIWALLWCMRAAAATSRATPLWLIFACIPVIGVLFLLSLWPRRPRP